MNWIDTAWWMMSAATLTFALIHLLVWLKQRSQLEHLILGAMCLSMTAIALMEQMAMRAQTPQQFASALRWGHVPVAVLFTCMVGFVRIHFRAGNFWLGVTVIGIRWAILLPDFLTGVNLNFREITSLRQIAVWHGGGATLAIPVGTANPWMMLGPLSVLLMIVFLIAAAVSVRRRGDREAARRAAFVCGNMAGFMLLAGGWTLAVVHGDIQAPVVIVPAFLGVVLVMSYELGADLMRVAQLARNLQLSDWNLKATEQRMQMAVHAAGIGLWHRDMRGETWLSEPSLRMLGFASGEVFDRERFYERMHPADREKTQNAVAEAARTGGELKHEYRIVNPDGHMHWIAVRGQVEFGADRAPTRLHGVLLDITELRQAEERFRLVVETARTAMLMVDVEGDIVLANQQAEVVFGYSRGELLSLHVDTLVPAQYRAGHSGDRAGYAANATARTIGAGRELFGQRKDGSQVPVEIALNPIQTDQGLFTLTLVVDISERKRAEREAALQRDELAHLSRVALLAELSGSLAHELNQPLTAILSNAQAAIRYLAHKPPNLNEVREILTNIVENDKHAGEVIRRLRAMLRKDATNYRRLDINEVVQDVLRIIRSDLLNRSVEIVLQLAPDLPAVNGDRVQLQQVLLNLIVNGSDAMAENTQERQLTVSTKMPVVGEVEVTVCDVGPGIAPEDIERIFSPFVTSKADGMGLGLAVCTTIINAHRGRLWATNNATRGATLHFCIPVFSDASSS